MLIVKRSYSAFHNAKYVLPKIIIFCAFIIHNGRIVFCVKQLIENVYILYLFISVFDIKML